MGSESSKEDDIEAFKKKYFYENGVQKPNVFQATFSDGNRYDGQLEDNERNGYGILYKDNNLVYIGQFKNNNYHGNGTLYLSNGQIIKGNFVNGIQQTQQSSETEYVYSPGKSSEKKEKQLQQELQKQQQQQQQQQIQLQQETQNLQQEQKQFEQQKQLEEKVQNQQQQQFQQQAQQEPQRQLIVNSKYDNQIQQVPNKVSDSSVKGQPNTNVVNSVFQSQKLIFADNQNQSQQKKLALGSFQVESEPEFLQMFNSSYHPDIQGEQDLMLRDQVTVVKTECINGFPSINKLLSGSTSNQEFGNDPGIETQLKAQIKDFIEQFKYEHLLTKENNLRQGIFKGKVKGGDIYIGELLEKNMHGKGMYQYKNGEIYIGNFMNNKFNGNGMYCFVNGERYEGNFINGMKEHQGKYYYKNGNFYNGNWSQDKKNGWGFYYDNVNKKHYEGNFINGKKEGWGIVYNYNTKEFKSVFYQKEYVTYEQPIEEIDIDQARQSFKQQAQKQLTQDLLKSNQKQQSKPNLIPIDEQFNQVQAVQPQLIKISNYQKQINQDYGNILEYQQKGSSFISSNFPSFILNDTVQKEGPLSKSNSAQAVVAQKMIEFNNDLLNEYRQQFILNEFQQYRPQIIIQEMSDEFSYEGVSLTEQIEGQGIFYYLNGDIYAGEWKQGKFYGTGLYLYKNGEHYEGEFGNGQKSGKGKFYQLNQNVYEGDWFDDKQNGFGIYFDHQRQLVYEGYWRNGVKEGQGKLYNVDGIIIYQGLFMNGQPLLSN